MAESSVAVIVVNWNSEHDLDKCLNALISQTLLPSRIIVLDNGSEGFEDQLWQKRFPNVEFHALLNNLGFASASNIGASIASECQWLAFLNPDAFPEKDWLEVLIEATKTNLEFNFFASLLISKLHPDTIDGAGEMYHSCGLAWRRGHLSALADCTMERNEVFGACGAAALISRKIFMDAGGFDERYFCYFEDVDLSFRLRLLGGRCLFIPEARVHHIGNGSSSQWSNLAVYYGHRNMVLTYFKNMPTFLFWYFLPQHLLINLFSLYWCAKRGQGRLAVRAKCDAIKMLTTFWKTRKMTQGKKVVSIASLARILTRGFARHHHFNNPRN